MYPRIQMGWPKPYTDFLSQTPIHLKGNSNI